MDRRTFDELWDELNKPIKQQRERLNRIARMAARAEVAGALEPSLLVAGLSSSQAIASGAYVSLALDNIIIDQEGMAVPGPPGFYTIRVSKPGLYLITGLLSFQANSIGSRIAQINFRGSAIGWTRTPAVSGAETLMSVAALVYTDVSGPPISFTVYQDSGSTLTVTNYAGVSPLLRVIRLSR